MKETSLEFQRRGDEKSFLPCKIQIKSVFKIMRQPPGLVTPK